MKVRMKLRGLLEAFDVDRKNRIIEIVRDIAKAQGIEPEEIEVKRSTAIFGVTELHEGEQAALQTISTRDMDRDKEILMPKGCDVSQFEKAPQVLEGHDYTKPPIARAEGMSIDAREIKAKVKFAPTERGQEFWELVKGGFLRTCSVGFIPLDTIDKSHEDWPKTIAQLVKQWPEFAEVRDTVQRIIRKWLLLEFSYVSVPANINALTQAVAKGEIDLSEDMLAKLGIEKKEKKKEPPKEPKKKEVKPPEPKPAKREIDQVATPIKREIEVVETPSERVVEKIAQEKLDIKRGMI